MDDVRTAVDEEHLRLLRVGYFIAGGVSALGAIFCLLYIGMGFMLAAMARGGGRGADEMLPAAVFMAAFGGVFFLVLVGAAVLKFLAAWALRVRRSRALPFVAAAVSLFSIPWGTALGVLTFVVLSRPSVAERFGPPREPGTLTP